MAASMAGGAEAPEEDLDAELLAAIEASKN
jgi:hypothetical protein